MREILQLNKEKITIRQNSIFSIFLFIILKKGNFYGVKYIIIGNDFTETQNILRIIMIHNNYIRSRINQVNLQ